MKRLTQELPIGKAHQGIDVYATVQVEGEKPTRFKCESFIGAFVRELYGMMAGGSFERPAIMGAQDGTGNSAFDYYTAIDSVTTNANNEININASYDDAFQAANNWNQANPTRIWVWGVGGIPEANGVHFIEKMDDDQAYLVDEAGARLTSVGAYTAGTGRFVTYQNFAYRNTNSANLGLAQWRVIVGDGTAAVKASDIGLTGRLQHGSGAKQLVPDNITSYGAQTTNKPSTRMALTRSFTNNSGADIEVNEIGIITSTSDNVQNADYTQFLILRDVLAATTNIPAGKKLTVDYEIVFELSPDTQDTDLDGTNGGFLKRFLQLLRANLTNDDDERAGYFGMGLGGGISNPTDADNLVGWQFGLRLGTNNTYTSMTDADLLGPINHGEADGQLWHHGTNFNPPVIDDVANEAYYSVTKIFENRGATAITVSEMGLYGNNRYDGSFLYTSNPKLLTRTALAPADQRTVQPDDFLLAKYIIKAVV